MVRMLANWRKEGGPHPSRAEAEAQLDADADADAELEAPAPPSPAPAPPDLPPEPGTPAAYWAQLQSELAIEQGGSFDRWVHDTWVIAYEDGEFIIGLPDAFRYDWIVHRLSKQIKRKLSVIAGQPVEVKFRVQLRPTNGSNP